VQHIVYKVADSREKPKLKVKFEKNETVRISEGPFATFQGIVDEVNEDRETLKVMVRFSAALLRWSWSLTRWRRWLRNCVIE